MNIPNQMTAVRITAHGGPEVLETVQVAVPTLSATEALIKVSAVALNNTDLWTRAGAYGLPGDPQARAGWRGPLEFPRVQGADVAGTVVAVGAAGDRALVGKRVVIDPAIYESPAPEANPIGLMGSERDGGYAEFVTAPLDQIHDVSASPLSEDQLAALPTAYGTALGMIERGRLKANDTALITGASGGVGLALIQLARARGAKVLAVTSPNKADAVQAAGAQHTIDRTENVVDQIRQFAPQGIDVALDVVAGNLVSDGLSLLREGGAWVIAGALGGYEVQLDVRRMYLHNTRVIGSSMHTRQHFALLMDLARRGEIAPVIAETFPLQAAAVAQEELARRSHIGKITMHP